MKDSTEVAPSNLKIDWDMTPDVIRQGRTVIMTSRIESYLVMDSSWVKINSMSGDILESNQRIFDRAHFLAEKNWRASLSADLPMEVFLDSCRVQFAEGLGLEETNANFRQIAWREEGGYFFSALSYICLVPVGSLGRISGPTNGLSLESGVLLNNRMVSAEIAFGRGSYLNHSVTMKGASADGEYVPYLGVYLKYSRTLLDTGGVRLSLFGGGGYSQRSVVKDNNPLILGGASLSEGFVGEWKCYTKIQAQKKPFRKSDYVLRLRLYSDQIWYPAPRIFSPTFNFSIGIGGTNGIVRLF